MKDRLFEIWFALRIGTACTEFQTLLEHYGTPYDIFNADESELEAMPISPRLRQALGDKSLQESNRIMEYCRKSGVGILFFRDENYPIALRSLRDPPALLYYRGRLPDFNRRLCISMVGTRSMSEYGKRMAYKIGYELAAAGTVVVSGMALGNDSVATAAAICAGGTTVAVLGSGIDVVYPREHEHLYGEISRTGVIMTEYAPGTPPAGHHFPVRNRIISGLSQGTLVVEGDLKSGSMITAKTAILQGRDIYAIPGNIGETNSAGTNQLISEGAAVVLRARDIVDNYAFLYRDALDLTGLFRAERDSDLNEESLVCMGVYTRTVKPKNDGSKSTRQIPAVGSDKPKANKPTVPSAGASAAERKAPAAPSKPSPRQLAEERTAKNDSEPTERTQAGGDTSRRVMESLTDLQRRVFEAIPIDGTIAVETLVRDGFSMSEVMASVTILEIRGLVQTFPGSLVARR